MYELYLKNLKLNKNLEVQELKNRLSSLSPGFTGADIFSVCNEAAIYAVRNKWEYVDSIDFEMAIEKVIGGIEKE